MLLIESKNKLYYRLEKRYSAAFTCYHEYKSNNAAYHKRHRFSSLSYLSKLMLSERKGKDVSAVPSPKGCGAEAYGTNDCRAVRTDSLSDTHVPGFERIPADELAEKLSGYDIISFDVFDTLIFRPFEKPSGLFYLLEARNGLFNFSELRAKAEQAVRARESEPDIYDIYKELSRYYGSGASVTAECEISAELEFCRANPYMKQVVEALKKKKKRLIAVSDIYLHSDTIGLILAKCGYEGFSDIFVSCEYAATKSKGELQRVVTKDLGTDKSYVHIGGDLGSDIGGSEAVGWRGMYYEKCGDVCKDSRPQIYRSPVSSMCRALSANRLFNGTAPTDERYRFGFRYAGPVVCGFCEWLNELSRQRSFDRLLFLARDTDVFYKAYKSFYPQADSKYVSASRFAVQQLVFGRYTEEYFIGVIQPRCNRGKMLCDVLKEIGMGFLSDELGKYALKSSDLLSSGNLERFKTLLCDNTHRIEESFADAEEAAKAYFTESLKGATHVCVVDLGWRGSEIAYLKYLLEERWQTGICVDGAVLGITLGVGTRSLVSRGVITPYAYSHILNRDFLHVGNRVLEEINLMLLEAVFTSEEPSLIAYKKGENGRCEPVTYPDNPNAEIVRRVQTGALDFVAELEQTRSEVREFYPFSAVDAFEPLNSVLTDYKYMARVFGAIKDTSCAIAGFYSRPEYIELGQLMMERRLIEHWPLKE